MLHIVNRYEVSKLEFDKWFNYLNYHNIIVDIEMCYEEFIKISFTGNLDISDEDLAYLEDDSIECRYKEELEEISQEDLLDNILEDINKLDEKRLTQLKKEFDI